MELRKKLRHPLLNRKPYVPATLDNPAAERESFTAGVGSKSKACLKFFSTSGCPYGEACHFSHYIPGGLSSLALSQTASQVLGVSSHKGVTVPSELSSALFSPSEQKSSSDGHKTKLCKNYGTLQGCHFGDRCHFEHVEEKRKVNGHMLAGRVLDRLPQFSPVLKLPPFDKKVVVCKNFQGPEGCRFGDKCHFAHGEMDIMKPNRLMGATGVKLEEKFLLRSVREPTPPGLGLAATTFGALSTAKVSIAASLAGLIIGKGGVNAKAISRATGAKLFVKDHESDSNLKNIEMEGSFDQIQKANSLVKELLIYMDAAPKNPGSLGTLHYKTKLCDNFLKGSCTYGDRCHFAHGPDDLQASMQ